MTLGHKFLVRRRTPPTTLDYLYRPIFWAGAPEEKTMSKLQSYLKRQHDLQRYNQDLRALTTLPAPWMVRLEVVSAEDRSACVEVHDPDTVAALMAVMEQLLARTAKEEAGIIEKLGLIEKLLAD